MNYPELSQKLVAVGQLLARDASHLSGEAPAKIARALATNALKLEKLLQAASLENSPEAARLRDALVHSSLSVAQMQSVTKKLALKISGGKSATPQKVREQLVALAVSSAVADKALLLVNAIARAQKNPAPDTSSEEKIRAEFRRLGALSAEEIEIELEENFSDEQVRSFAKILGMKTTRAAKKKGLVPKLIPYIQRHHENTK